jgi:hypothetical protein
VFYEGLDKSGILPQTLSWWMHGCWSIYSNAPCFGFPTVKQVYCEATPSPFTWHNGTLEPDNVRRVPKQSLLSKNNGTVPPPVQFTQSLPCFPDIPIEISRMHSGLFSIMESEQVAGEILYWWICNYSKWRQESIYLKYIPE